jgi:lysophospholipase
VPIPAIEIVPQTSLRYRCWPAVKPKAALLLVHGLGAHSARWDFLAAYFQANNFSCWAIELQGFGATPGPRGHINSFQQYYDDLFALRNFVQQTNPQLKIFCLGESLGSLMAFRMAQLHPAWTEATVLISPAFANNMKFSLMDYLTLISGLLFAPRTALKVPFTAAMCTRDEAYQQLMQASPLEVRTASAQLLFQSLLEQIRASRELEKITQPLLFLLAGRDFLVKLNASVKVFQKLRLAEKKLIHYPEMHHALSIDLGREAVFRDALDWLKARMPA